MIPPEQSMQRPLAIGFTLVMVLWIAVGVVPLGAASAATAETPLGNGQSLTMTGTDTTTGTNTSEETSNNIGTMAGADHAVVNRANELADTFETRCESGGNLANAAELAADGVKMQVGQTDTKGLLPDPAEVTLPDTPTPGYTTPSAVTFALLDRHNVTPTSEEAAAIRALDDLPGPTRRNLTAVLNAYFAYEVIQDQSGSNAQVRAAQLELLEATVGLNTSLERPDSPGLVTPTSHPVSPAGVKTWPISINLTTHDNTYGTDYPLLIDAGGDDIYNNNAGGATNYGAAALIDLGGKDHYYGQNGGGYRFAAGFLVDVGFKNDTYLAGGDGTLGTGANGGGYLGASGFLLDTGGNDTYNASDVGTNGGGAYSGGNGFLLDACGGNDEYDATNYGVNGGGAYAGKGFLLETGGNDTYTAGGKANSGVNGGARSDIGDMNEGHRQAAVGTLVDVAGNDTYTSGGSTKDDECSDGNEDVCLELKLPELGTPVGVGWINKKGNVGLQIDLEVVKHVE